MEKKSFKVTVNGQTFDVIVEEVGKGKREMSEEMGSESKEDYKYGKSEEPFKTNFTQPVEKSDKSATVGTTEKEKDHVPDDTKEAANVNAPMPGSIIEVKAVNGQEVKEGELLLILEAMKMENEITSPVSGTVEQILVKKGDTVNSGDKLVVIK